MVVVVVLVDGAVVVVGSDAGLHASASRPIVEMRAILLRFNLQTKPPHGGRANVARPQSYRTPAHIRAPRPPDMAASCVMRRLSHSIRVGLSFGLTSGVITTLGLLVGLSSGTSSQTAVIAGILTIAVADSLSDALGIHISEESEGVHTPSQVWTATLATFAAKFLMALTFAIPVILLPLETAVVVAIIWGAVALTVLSIDVGRRQGVDPKPIVFEHLGVGAIVIVAAHFVGLGISSMFA